MSWNKTCIAAESATDATGRIFKPGDKVAYIASYGDRVHTGTVKKINLNDENTIKTVWVTPDKKYEWDASGHSIYIMGEWKEKREKSYYGSYTRRYRDVIKKIETPFHDDKLVKIECIIKID